LRHQAYGSPTPRTAHFGARMLLRKDRRIKQTHGTNKRASSKLAIEMKTKTQEEGNVWVLTCESAEDVWELENGESYTVGRDNDNDLPIPIGTVSGAHATIEITKAGDCFVTDKMSTNGTYIGSVRQRRRVEPGSRTRVSSGQTVAFGDEQDSRCTFQMVFYDLREEEQPREVDYGQAAREARDFPGLQVPRQAVSVDSKLIGDGNFGQVFLGKVSGLPKEVSPDGNVVLKKALDRVGGAKEMLELELEMNHRISERVPGVCADYLGHCDVEPGKGGALYNKKLSDGLWLIWKAQGRYTLEYYMRERSYPKGLLKALTGSDKGTELDAARAATKALLKGLSALHAARFVHRDVKPPNILIIAAKKGGVLLIDLGACADLTDGFNFQPGTCPRDPRYCPPECDLMPEAATVDANGDLIVPKLNQFWDRFAPASFDIYSAGVVLVQLALEAVRSEKGLKQFNEQMDAGGHDLILWRDTTKMKLGDTSVLDANDGAGWELAASMLQKAHWDVDDGQKVTTKKSEISLRPTADEALKHPFFKDKIKA